LLQHIVGIARRAAVEKSHPIDAVEGGQQEVPWPSRDRRFRIGREAPLRRNVRRRLAHVLRASARHREQQGRSEGWSGVHGTTTVSPGRNSRFCRRFFPFDTSL